MVSLREQKKMMLDRRRAPRRQCRLPCKVIPSDGSAVRDAMVVDISDFGACVAVEDAASMPDEFALTFSPTGFPLRRCRMSWRTDNRIGVEFSEHGAGLYEFPQVADVVDPLRSSLVKVH